MFWGFVLYCVLPAVLYRGLLALGDWVPQRSPEYREWLRRRRPRYKVRWIDGVYTAIRKNR